MWRADGAFSSGPLLILLVVLNFRYSEEVKLMFEMKVDYAPIFDQPSEPCQGFVGSLPEEVY